MKALLLRWAARIDALSLRERALVGFGTAAAIVFIVYMGMTDPANAREKTLRATILQQRAQMAGIAVEVAQKEAAARADPDAAARARLATLHGENEQLRAGLRTAQKGLVAPARMSTLLQQMVQQNGKLKLLSLKTLPPAGTTDGNFIDVVDAPPGAVAAPGPVLPPTVLTTTPPGAAPAPASATGPATAAKDAPLLYRHGVRIVLLGAYPDMVAYMAALERLPAQLFWGRAVLDAAEHDKATLTLTLYTLSLDEKWIAL